MVRKVWRWKQCVFEYMLMSTTDIKTSRIEPPKLSCDGFIHSFCIAVFDCLGNMYNRKLCLPFALIPLVGVTSLRLSVALYT